MILLKKDHQNSVFGSAVKSQFYKKFREKNFFGLNQDI